jgi:hypothetical protein
LPTGIEKYHTKILSWINRTSASGPKPKPYEYEAGIISINNDIRSKLCSTHFLFSSRVHVIRIPPFIITLNIW